MKLGERLRLIRKEHRLTLKDLSQSAGLSLSYLSDMERGVVNPSVETLQKVARVYEMRLTELFIGVEDMGKSKPENYPEGFSDFLNDDAYKDELNADWKELLIGINFRGRRPSSKREWVELHLYLRRILSLKEEKVNDPKKYTIKLVQDAVKKYSSTEVPSFGEICTGLGLDVQEVSLPPGIDGMHKGKTIFINSQIQNEERKRFTQFHEVTHYLIEKDEDLISELHDATWSQKDGYEKPLEQLCNIGAAEFLMPSKAFAKLCAEKGFNVKLIPFAARYFKSSTIATTIQLAQVAPNKCITSVFEYGLIPEDTIKSRDQLFRMKHRSSKPKLHVAYSASSPAADRWLAKYTVFPDNHLINQAFSQTKMLEGESKIFFPSWQESCTCEALPHENKVYALFHLTPPPHPNQMSLF